MKHPGQYVVIDVEDYHGPFSHRLAVHVQRDHPGSQIKKLIPATDMVVEYLFGNAGSTPVRVWKELENDLSEKVRELGEPVATRWTDNDSTFVILAKFESDEETTAEARAHETWGELPPIAPGAVDMREVDE